MGELPITPVGALTAAERGALDNWARAHADTIAHPLLAAEERRRLTFVRWRRAHGRMPIPAAVDTETEIVCAALLAWTPRPQPPWTLCTPWDIP